MQDLSWGGVHVAFSNYVAVNCGARRARALDPSDAAKSRMTASRPPTNNIIVVRHLACAETHHRYTLC